MSATFAPAFRTAKGVSPPVQGKACSRNAARGPSASPPVGQRPTERAQRGVRDLEFLPAAVELIETPPSPIKLSLMLLICALLLGSIAWAFLGRLEIHAIAAGKIQPIGRTKIVQPSEPGRVSAFRVQNGSVVEAGELLIELDPTVAAADRTALEQTLASVTAEVAARKSALDWARNQARGSASAAMAFTGREAALVGAETSRLEAVLNNIAAQVGEGQARRNRLAASNAARARLLVLLKERADTRQTLDDSGLGYRGKVIDALESYERELTALVNDQGQLVEAEASLKSLETKRHETIAQFVTEQSRSLLDAERKRDQAAQDVIKAANRGDRLELRAPIAGVVQQLAVTTVGQVVQSGEALLVVVPLDGQIEVEALVANKDIGFVEHGQAAIVKIDAFPFTRYGTITGRLTRVSRDAVDHRAAGVATDVISAQKTGASSGATPLSLMFPITVTLDRTSINAGNADVALVPGMSVTVEIKTGERRVIDFLLSPVSEVITSSGKER